MSTNTVDKPARSGRAPATRRNERKNVKEARDQAATNTLARRRDARPDQQPPDRVTKHTLLLQLLNRAEGASIEEMMQSTGWQQHSIRGFLAGTVKKKMGLALRSTKAEGEVRRYQVATRRGR